MKRKSKINIDHHVQCLNFQKKNKNKNKNKNEIKNDIKLRSQVVLYVNQRGRVKQKFGDLSSNQLVVFFNLTKDMIGSLLSDQFQSMELDNKSYSLEYQYSCFYIGFLIH